MNKKCVIRQARSEDLDDLFQLELACFGEAEVNVRETFEKIIAYPEGYQFYVFLYQGKLAGFYCATFEKELAHLSDIVLSPDLQGQGFGSFLLDHCLKNLREKNCRFLTLAVRQSNQRALALYRKKQFEELEILRSYYGDEDGIKFQYRF